MFDRFKTKLKIITNIVLLVLSLSCYVLFLWGVPYLSRITDEMRQAFVQSEAGQERIQKVRDVLTNEAEVVTQVRGYVLNSERVVGFIEEMENLGRQAGVEESTKAVSATAYAGVDADKWEALSIAVSTTGSWADTYQFLSLLEHMPYRLEIQRATMGLDEDEKGRAVWKGDFTFSVLKMK